MSFCGDTICTSSDGIGTGILEDCGCFSRNFSVWFVESISAEAFWTTGMCDAMIAILNRTWRNHKRLSRCVTIGSFEVPLLMASTRLRLSHWNSVCDQAKKVPNGTTKHDRDKFFCHNAHSFPLIGPSMLQPLMIKECSTPPVARCICLNLAVAESRVPQSCRYC